MDDDIFLNEAEESKTAAARVYDSSPLAVGSRAGSGTGGSSRTRALGAKDLGEHLDRLTKQNFDLKLELDHRREKMTKLQEQIADMQALVERAGQLEKEHADLLQINSELVEELEKRDIAVSEAINIICDLEEKVADLEERNSFTRPSTANADSGYAGTETHEQAPPSSPPELSKAPKTPHVRQRQPPPAASAAAGKLLNVTNGQTPARPRREPTVLSQKKPSTHALRRVYLETTQSLHPVKSFNSLLSKRESKTEDEDEALNSPRLSVLSESSFPSIYSPKKQTSPERYAWEADEDEPLDLPHGPHLHFRQDSIKRVSQWMDERDETEGTPSKSNSISESISQSKDRDALPSPTKRPSDDTRYRSIGDALSTATTAAPSMEIMQGVSYVKPHRTRKERDLAMRQARPTTFGGPMFGEPLLPPTPDSASTRMLRTSRSSIADEKSLLDTTPAAVKGYDALEPGTRTAPKQMRSSVELNSAYHNYLRHREDDTIIHNDDDDDDDDDGDGHSEIIRDLSLEYDGFPDGNSILMGTPSRFLKHAKPPAANMWFDGDDVSPPQTARSPPRRRQSSSGVTVSPRKPSLSRAETSPTFVGGLARIVTSGPQSQSSGGSMTSPRSYHSGSSSNRTVVHPEERVGALSPDSARAGPQIAHTSATPTQTQKSHSPARALSQKTQKLFRRMSNSHRDTLSERQKSPLPTLTTTPSSAYVDEPPKEARRPGTSYSGEAARQRPPSSREGRRPSLKRTHEYYTEFWCETAFCGTAE